MNPTLTAQQIAFFAKNGYLELEGLFSEEECRQYSLAINPEKLKRLPLSEQLIQGRDLWRHASALKTLIFSRRLSTIAASLTPKVSLRVALDQWFPSDFSLPRPAKLNELFCIQGITCAIFIQLEPGITEVPEKTSPIGLFPFPKGRGNALIVQPNLLLNWPTLAASQNLYLIAYCQINSVYVQNSNDPAGLNLRALGYGYGDPLRNDTHPVMAQRG